MKYFITHNPQSPTGYAMIAEENGVEKVEMIEKTGLEKKTGINWLILPENPMNRKLINPAKVDKLGKVELTYKTPIVLGPRGENTTPRKKLEDYFTDEEKATIAELMEKAKERREADKPKPLTEIEKAKIKAQKAQAKYEALLAKNEQEWHLRKEGDK